MRKEKASVFLSLFFLSIIIYFLSSKGFLYKPSSLLSKSLFFLPKISFNLENREVRELKEQNLALSKRLVDQQKLIAENKALNDQFITSYPKSFSLLPTNIVGAPKFLPGISSPETFIIDVGEKDGAKVGEAVVFKDNLVGKIVKTNESFSQVLLITNPNSKFAAKTLEGVLGIVKGEGNGDIVLDNVLLSDTLVVGSLLQTGPDLKIDSIGLPPNLVVGKIVSTAGSSRELFQKAKVKSLLDFTRLSKVFVITTGK